MIRPHDFVVSLRDVDRDDTPYVGGKGANLGEMIQNKFPVPPGFVVTAHAYFEFLKINKLDSKIFHLLGTINYNNTQSLSQVSHHIRKLITSSPIPNEISEKVFEYYETECKSSLVAIRSSATSEDSKTASFAGQNETFLNVKGESSVLHTVREAWASLFEPRSLFYRNEKKLSHTKNGIALVVQKMVESEASGVMFTIDPVTNDKSKITIEAIFGLGEYIVQGKVTPDHYEVSKKSFSITAKKTNIQEIALKKVKGENKEVFLSVAKGGVQKIKDNEIIALAKLGEKIEKHYYFPQDIEWAKENNRIYIVQTRPITTTVHDEKNKKDSHRIGIDIKDAHPILIGDPASPGIGIGKVKKIYTLKDIKKVEKGDILVAPFTNPDYVPAMKKASGIITERGGRTSHAAIVSREFGIPAVVGTPNALTVLKDNQTVTVNGNSGEIFSGSVLISEKNHTEHEFTKKTATKLYVNLAEPELADKVSMMNVDGIGLLRAEFMIAQIGTHPKKFIKDKKQQVFIDKLAESIAAFCKAFYPRPVLYRATDFKTNEYSHLKGGKEYEVTESNPMLGYRGAFRYIRDKSVFLLELEALKKVRGKMGLNNLNLMIPFVRTVKELVEVKKIISDAGLRRSHTFKLFMMAEIPANVILIDDFINTGIDGVSIGSNDLTMLVLGIDRDNSEVAPEFDERNEAVLWSLERVIKACNKHNIPVSICGQAPSVYPSLVEKLVEFGVTSVSVSPDAVLNTKRIIYAAEQKILDRSKK